MKLLGNTVLQYGETNVNYEILLLEQTLLFKPWFYHLEQDFPCIVLNRVATTWEPDDKIDLQVERQIREDLAGLQRWQVGRGANSFAFQR